MSSVNGFFLFFSCHGNNNEIHKVSIGHHFTNEIMTSLRYVLYIKWCVAINDFETVMRTIHLAGSQLLQSKFRF